jgi:hypothetical protein
MEDVTLGALLGEPGGGAPVLGAPKIMKGMLWEWAMGNSLHGGSGNLEWAPVPRTSGEG